jgi:hypothetical protein
MVTIKYFKNRVCFLSCLIFVCKVSVLYYWLLIKFDMSQVKCILVY